MNCYSLLQRLKYLSIAKTRHGVHSPFVYEFIEKVLRNRNNIPLIQKIENYFGKEKIVFLDPEKTEDDLLLRKEFSTEKIYLFPNIYKTKCQTQTWRQLYNISEASLSIDIYEYGLIFFKKEFRQKQHFIIK